MTRAILTAIFLTLFSQTAWAEKLNAELLCKGYWNVDFRSVEGEDAFASDDASRSFERTNDC